MDDELTRGATEAYVFAYPLVLMDITRAVMTGVPAPGKGKAPVNQFAHLDFLPDDTFTDVVRPNNDTLYSTAWLDVGEEPMVLSVPDTAGRYYLMPLLDAWTNVFASPGSRTTGTGEGHFAITGPGWQGNPPDGLRRLPAPTGTVWLIGRTQVNGHADLQACRSTILQYHLTPLSAWGTDYQPPERVPATEVDTSEPLAQVERMDAQMFFGRAARLIDKNPPSPQDGQALDNLARFGVEPGKPFDLGAVDPGTRQALDGAAERAFAAMDDHMRTAGRLDNGWNVLISDIGTYGTNYLRRATIARVGLGANLPEDAVYPNNAGVDRDGNPLSGKRRYVIRFQPGQTPATNAFWSITMYDQRGFLVNNPIGRYAIGDRDQLDLGDDGSLTIYIQHDAPGPDKERNWLPAPEGVFSPTMRIYWPKEAVLQGTWHMPPIEPSDQPT